MKVLVKIHKIYRKIVAMCDIELLGKKFTEGELQLDVNTYFYGGDVVAEKQAFKLLEDANKEDACFNFVGKNAVKIASRAGIIDKNRILVIDGIPHAMALL